MSLLMARARRWFGVGRVARAVVSFVHVVLLGGAVWRLFWSFGARWHRFIACSFVRCLVLVDQGKK